MNKMRCFLAAIVALVVMAGCGKKVDVAWGTSSLNIAPEGESVEVALTSNGDWTIDAYPDWLTVSPTSGNGDATITLVAPLNDSDATRSDEVRVTTKDNTATLKVAQEAMEQDYISVSPDAIECEAEGGTFTLTVSSNCEWSVSNAADWMTCEPASGSGDGTVAVTISPIEGDEAFRESSILFSGAGLELLPVHVLQHAAVHVTINVTPAVLPMGYEGGEQTIAVDCEGSWTVSTDADWVSLGATSGNGNANLTVVVAENESMEPRMATLDFVTETGDRTTASVKQDGAPDPHHLEVTPSTVSFNKDGGTAEISVSCDTDWTVSTTATWIALSVQTGTGDATFTLSAEANTILEARQASVSVESNGLVQRVVVAQEAGEQPVVVTVEPDTLFVAYTGGIQHVSITANTNWTLVNDAEWILLLTTTGTGDATADFVVDSNSSETGRVTTINIAHGLQTMCSVVVVQEGRPSILETDVVEIEARPEGGEYTVHVTANQSWSIETSADWLVCVPASGSGNGEFVVKVDPMVSIQPRSTELRIYGSFGSYLVIPVTQSN